MVARHDIGGGVAQHLMLAKEAHVPCLAVVNSYAGFSPPDAWTFVRDKATIAAPVHTRLIVGSAEAACAAARAGMGISIAFAYQIEAGPEEGALTTVLDEFQPPSLPVNLVYTANRFLPIKVRAFLDFSAPRLKRVFGE